MAHFDMLVSRICLFQCIRLRTLRLTNRLIHTVIDQDRSLDRDTLPQVNDSLIVQIVNGTVVRFQSALYNLNEIGCSHLKSLV